MKKNRFIPYGYTMRNGRTVIEHTEADIIREIFADYIDGASLKDIAESLTQRKIPYTEKTDVWDKARIARILDNAKYTGDGDYDPIIDETTYEIAGAAKSARQRKQIKQECEGISLIRNHVKCETCGWPMARRINSKRKIPESWVCSNGCCGVRVAISDTDLLQKINLLMNRIIENNDLMLPKTQKRYRNSPAVNILRDEISREMEREHPSEVYIAEKLKEIASQLYRESQAQELVAAQIARKRVAMMEPQQSFSCGYFADMISYITLDRDGRVTLHTKTETEIGEGDEA